MSDLRFPTENPADAVSPRLGEALRSVAGADAGGSRLVIPRRVDDAVMAAARARLAVVVAGHRGLASSDRWTIRRAAACAAVAASLALAAVLAMPRPHAGDVNRDGSVDILDAYRLARGIDRGERVIRADVTRDGVVDQRDVQWIAQHVVRLPEDAG